MGQWSDEHVMAATLSKVVFANLLGLTVYQPPMVDVTHYSLLSSAIRQQMILKATHTQHITQM